MEAPASPYTQSTGVARPLHPVAFASSTSEDFDVMSSKLENTVTEL